MGEESILDFITTKLLDTYSFSRWISLGHAGIQVLVSVLVSARVRARAIARALAIAIASVWDRYRLLHVGVCCFALPSASVFTAPWHRVNVEDRL